MESLHLQHLFYCKYLLYSRVRVRVEGVRMRVKAHVNGMQGVRHARVHKLLGTCVYALWVRVMVSRSKAAVSKGKILAGGNYIPNSTEQAWA
jgi:hypothetical protein